MKQLFESILGKKQKKDFQNISAALRTLGEQSKKYEALKNEYDFQNIEEYKVKVIEDLFPIIKDINRAMLFLITRNTEVQALLKRFDEMKGTFFQDQYRQGFDPLYYSLHPKKKGLFSFGRRDIEKEMEQVINERNYSPTWFEKHSTEIISIGSALFVLGAIGVSLSGYSPETITQVIQDIGNYNQHVSELNSHN